MTDNTPIWFGDITNGKWDKFKARVTVNEGGISTIISAPEGRGARYYGRSVAEDNYSFIFVNHDDKLKITHYTGVVMQPDIVHMSLVTASDPYVSTALAKRATDLWQLSMYEGLGDDGQARRLDGYVTLRTEKDWDLLMKGHIKAAKTSRVGGTHRDSSEEIALNPSTTTPIDRREDESQ